MTVQVTFTDEDWAKIHEDEQKCVDIRRLISRKLEVYPGSDVILFINELFDILNREPEP